MDLCWVQKNLREIVESPNVFTRDLKFNSKNIVLEEKNAFLNDRLKISSEEKAVFHYL